MVLNTPYRLPEAVLPAMLVIRMAESMLMEDHAGVFCRITGAVQIPIVTGVSTLDCYVHVVSQNNIEICRIYLLKLFTVKHTRLLIVSS